MANRSSAAGVAPPDPQLLPHVPRLQPHNLPVCVRLRKYQRRVYQSCDVYIGGSSQTWRLAQSEWSNPFAHLLDEDNGNPKRSLDSYRRHILNNRTLRNKLPSLMGCRLGTFYGNQAVSHGHVLRELVRDRLLRITVPCSKSSRGAHHSIETGEVIFFKGEKCPASDLYRCSLRYYGLVFMSAYHLSVWKRARELNKAIARRVAACTTHKDVVELDRELNFSRLSRDRYIRMHYEVMCVKYDQVREFREWCGTVNRRTVIYCVDNPFWGGGVDFHSLTEQHTAHIDRLPGLNISGWLIECISMRESDPMFAEAMDKLSGRSENVPIFQGLYTVLKNIADGPLLLDRKRAESSFQTVTTHRRPNRKKNNRKKNGSSNARR